MTQEHQPPPINEFDPDPHFLTRKNILPLSYIALIYSLPHYPQLQQALENPHAHRHLLAVFAPNHPNCEVLRTQEENNRLTSFLSTKVSVPILEFLAEADADLPQLPIYPQDLSEDTLTEHLLVKLDPDLSAWHPQATDVHEYSRSQLKPLQTKHWDTLFFHPNLKTLISLVSHQQIYKLLDNKKIEINFMLTFPFFTKTLANLYDKDADLKYESFATPDWGQRLTSLDQILSTLGLSGTTDSDVNQAIIDSFSPDTLHEISAAKNPQVEQNRQLYRTRNSLTLLDQIKLRHQIRQEGKIVDPEFRQQQLTQISWLESPHNPLHRFLASFGTETEASFTNHLPTSLYHLANSLGFRAFGAEFSPGPFAHWYTSRIVHQTWIDGWLLDLYQDQKSQLSAHTNIGRVNSRFLSAILMRIHQLTGDCWTPRWGKDQEIKNPDSQSLELHLNQDVHKQPISGLDQNRFECKDFRVLTPKGLSIHNFSVHNLATAIRGLESFKVRFENWPSLNDPEIRSQIIHQTNQSSELSPIQRELALIAISYFSSMYAGLRQIHLEEFLAEEVPMELARTVGLTNNAVLPLNDIWARDLTDPNETFMPDQVFTYRGQLFNNAIAFSRHITYSHAIQTAHLLEKAMGQFHQLESHIPNSKQKLNPEAEADLTTLNNLFVLLPKGSDPYWIFNKLEEIRDYMHSIFSGNPAPLSPPKPQPRSQRNISTNTVQSYGEFT